MQGRMGPSVLQPFLDVRKLLSKENIVVNKAQKFYVLCFLVFIIFTGALFFAGADILLVIFALTLASIFLVLGAYSTFSPYSYIGAERELIQMMSYEPMVILAAIGMFMVTRSFAVADIAGYNGILFYQLPGVFIGLVFILTIKFRKSPFDLSMSHHAHQEIVRGVLTEFSGQELAMVEIAHWYENLFLLGFVYLFFASQPWLALAVVILTYFVEILIDNNSARLNWQLTMASSWLVAAIFGAVNLLVLSLL
jgi:formate hydrogenlyase subunit 4